MASIAFNTHIDLADVYVEGIAGITHKDVEYAGELGYVIKLLAIAKSCGDDVEARVHPALVCKDSLLASVRGEYNALLLEGDIVGTTMYYGKGAGKYPTASAIVGDLIDIGKNMQTGSTLRTKPFEYVNERRVKSIEEVTSLYYIRFTALDMPGVLSLISGILGKYEISIASVIQKAQDHGKHVPLVIMTHEALERDVRSALAEIDAQECIKGKSVLIRMV
jgi:homoserine dehydrogenase